MAFLFPITAIITDYKASPSIIHHSQIYPPREPKLNPIEHNSQEFDTQYRQQEIYLKQTTHVFEPQPQACHCTNSLVKPETDIALDTGSQVNFSLEIELDADEQSSSLLLAILVSSTLKQLT